MDRKITIGRKQVFLCMIWAITMIGCTRVIPSVPDAVKLAGEGVTGRVKVTGYCRPDQLIDWLFEKPGVHRWEGAKIALDVNSMFDGVSAEARREQRIRRLLALEGNRVEIVGTLKPGPLDLTQRHSGIIVVEEIRVIEEPSVGTGPALILPATCPYGHSTFQHVRIIWGGPSRAPDAMALEALQRHEITYAGTDVFGPGSPEWTVYCTTCGFMAVRDYVSWTREAEESSGFVQPFSGLAREFPMPPVSQRSRTIFSQGLRNGRVARERVYYVTTETLSTLKEQVSEWAARHGLRLAPEKLPEEKPYRLYAGGMLLTAQYQGWGNESDASVGGLVQFHSYPTEGKVSVDLSITLKSSEKESIDDASGRAGRAL